MDGSGYIGRNFNHLTPIAAAEKNVLPDHQMFLCPYHASVCCFRVFQFPRTAFICTGNTTVFPRAGNKHARASAVTCLAIGVESPYFIRRLTPPLPHPLPRYPRPPSYCVRCCANVNIHARRRDLEHLSRTAVTSADHTNFLTNHQCSCVHIAPRCWELLTKLVSLFACDVLWNNSDGHDEGNGQARIPPNRW